MGDVDLQRAHPAPALRSDRRQVRAQGEPKLDAGPPQQITYEISDRAQWSDRRPITSHDFKYTWQQIVTGDDILDTSGYESIESIDDSNPKIAVVTFAQGENYAAWKDLFGGQYGILPSHILEGNDRAALMTDGYDWSGGPYIGKWTRGSDTTLTANPDWYGPRPKIRTVVFQPVLVAQPVDVAPCDHRRSAQGARAVAGRPVRARGGSDAARRSRRRPREPISARVLRRAASAHRDRPGARTRTRGSRAR
jgi:hypothetical protein